jgi:hypothetical protein
MALIQRGMYETFAARHLAVKGPGALTNLEEGVMGTLPLDLSSSPPYWFLQGFRTFSGNPTATAAAGRIAKIALHPPASSQVICYILHLSARMDSDTIGVYRAERTDITADATTHGKGTDTRISEDASSQAELITSDETPAIPGELLFSFNTGDQTAVGNPIPLIVSPGQVIYVANHTTGDQLEASICWVELPAYKAEL